MLEILWNELGGRTWGGETAILRLGENELADIRCTSIGSGDLTNEMVTAQQLWCLCSRSRRALVLRSERSALDGRWRGGTAISPTRGEAGGHNHYHFPQFGGWRDLRDCRTRSVIHLQRNIDSMAESCSTTGQDPRRNRLWQHPKTTDGILCTGERRPPS